MNPLPRCRHYFPAFKWKQNGQHGARGEFAHFRMYVSVNPETEEWSISLFDWTEDGWQWGGQPNLIEAVKMVRAHFIKESQTLLQAARVSHRLQEVAG